MCLSFAAVEEIKKNIALSFENPERGSEYKEKKMTSLKKPVHVVPVYDYVDTSLLYKLIRIVCPAVKSTGKWGLKTDDACKNIGDDIERRRIFQTDVYTLKILKSVECRF